jgi:hypothetical protein
MIKKRAINNLTTLEKEINKAGLFLAITPYEERYPQLVVSDMATSNVKKIEATVFYVFPFIISSNSLEMIYTPAGINLVSIFPRNNKLKGICDTTAKKRTINFFRNIKKLQNNKK